MIRLATIMILVSFMLGCGTFGGSRTIVDPGKTEAVEITENEGEKSDEGESVTYGFTESEDRKPFKIKVFERWYEVPVFVKTLTVKLKKQIVGAALNTWSKAFATGPGLSTTSDELVG